MQWPSRIVKQKLDADQIQQHPQGPRDVVIGLAAAPADVLDRNLSDGGSLPTSQRRNEAVQIPVQLQFSHNLSTISFEGSAEIVKLNARQPGHHSVGNPTRNSSGQPGVFPFDAPAADDVIPFQDLFDELRNLSRVMLEVAIHRNDDFAVRIIETCLERRCLAKISPETNQSNPLIMIRDLF